MKKEEIFLDLSKCSQEEIKNVLAVLPDEGKENQYTIKDEFIYLNYVEKLNKWWVFDESDIVGKTEIKYSQFMELMKPQPTELVTQITELLKGIDKDECEVDYGWWETSDGAKFGKGKLNKLIHLVNSQPSELEKEMFEFIESLLDDGVIKMPGSIRANSIIEKYKNKYGG